MAIRIIVDSASDISTAQAARLGIDMVGIGVIVEDQSYVDGLDIDLKYLAKVMKAGKDVKTSMGTYQQFYDAFEKYADGGDEVIYFSFSSGISGNYQTAVLASSEIKEKYPDYKLHVIDTKLALTGLQMFILDAIKLNESGASVNMILEYLEVFRDKLYIAGSIEDLYYLVKGGRVSNAKAIIGNMLNVKPVISLVDGKLLSVGKVRGLKKFYKFAIQEIKKSLPNKANTEEHILGISHFNNYEGVSEIKQLAEKQLGVKKFIVSDMSVAVSAHIGPAGIVVFYSPMNVEFWNK